MLGTSVVGAVPAVGVAGRAVVGRGGSGAGGTGRAPLAAGGAVMVVDGPGWLAATAARCDADAGWAPTVTRAAASTAASAAASARMTRRDGLDIGAAYADGDGMTQSGYSEYCLGGSSCPV